MATFCGAVICDGGCSFVRLPALKALRIDSVKSQDVV
jgi:hypothetical protein